MSKWCGSKACGCRNRPGNSHCYKCNCQLSDWLSASGGRVPGSSQDAAAKKREQEKRDKDKKAKELRDKDAAAAKCLCCGGKGHTKAECRQKDKVCSNCGKSGHLAHVCRSAKSDQAPAKAAAGAVAISQDVFEEEAKRRGWIKDASAPVTAEAGPVEATTASLIDSKKAVDKADKDFKAAAKKVQDTREAHEKAVELLTTTSDVLSRAEIALQKAVASLTPPAAPPTLAPVASNPVTKPAIDVEQLLDASGDPTKMAALFVHLGKGFDLDGIDEDDRAALQTGVTDLTQTVVGQVATIFTALTSQKDVIMKGLEDSRAKKRRGGTGAALPATPPGAPLASLPSSAAPAAVNAADVEAKAASEAKAAAEAKALEEAQATAASARRSADAAASLAAHQAKVAKELADAKAEEDRLAAQAVAQAKAEEAAAETKKLAEHAEASRKQEALDKIAKDAKDASLLRIQKEEAAEQVRRNAPQKRESSTPPQGTCANPKKLVVAPSEASAGVNV